MGRIKLTLPQTFPFSTNLSVRITDVNYGGHLGNDALLSLLHEARVRFFASMGFTEQDAGGAGIIMVDAAILYRSEAFSGDDLTIEVAADDLHSHGCDIVYRVTNRSTGKEVAKAKTGIAFFDYTNRRIVAVPDRFRTAVLAAGARNQ